MVVLSRASVWFVVDYCRDTGVQHVLKLCLYQSHIGMLLRLQALFCTTAQPIWFCVSVRVSKAARLDVYTFTML